MSGIDQVHHFFDAAVAPGVVEQPLLFDCEEAQLVGILARPQAMKKRGILIVVGGPQYRAGSHRQFVLMARDFAAQGYASLRFDYRGMGDSGGETRDFREVRDDLRSAVRAFRQALPQIEEIVILGLCDAASAAMMFGHEMEDVRGMVLINPWSRSQTTHATTQLKHYYGAKLFDPRLWRKLLGGRFEFKAAWRDLVRTVRAALGAKEQQPADGGFQMHMAEGLRHFTSSRAALLLLSGNDLVAREFLEYAASSRAWQGVLASPCITRHHLPQADHTFSRAEWRAQVEKHILAWLSQPLIKRKADAGMNHAARRRRMNEWAQDI